MSMNRVKGQMYSDIVVSEVYMGFVVVDRKIDQLN